MAPDLERLARTPWPIASLASSGIKALSSAFDRSWSRKACRLSHPDCRAIDARRQSALANHAAARQLSLRATDNSHPDCRASPIQIVALYRSLV